MNLKDRLARIYGQPSARSSPLSLLEGPAAGLAEYLGGEWLGSDWGEVLSVRRSYPLHYRHGRLPLQDFLGIDREALCLLAGDLSFQDLCPSRVLFLDTETTGLAGGAGTTVFLVGLGFFQGDRFVVQQLFLPGFHQERAFLLTLSRLVASREGGEAFRYLVTFNGKGYDLNLLENRFVLQRLEPSLGELHHLDLLYCSRLLWKGSFPDCALQTLERHVLGVQRQGDIPSAQIPQLYFRYLRSGEFQAFEQIFRHNRVDLLSLVSLLTLACQAIQDPERRLYVEPLKAARLFQQRGLPERAAQLLERTSRHQQSPSRRLDLLLPLAFLKKRLGRPEEALQLFHEIVQSHPRPPLEAYEEAAKILEHHQKQLEGALALVEEALQWYDEESLKKRRHRLQHRLQGKRWY